MAFNAQTNVSTGGFIDATRGLRDTLGGIQKRVQDDKLLAMKQEQQALDNQYRSEQAQATADYRTGQTNRANAAEARAQNIYQAGLDKTAADAMAGSIYTDTTTVNKGALQGDALSSAITESQGRIAEGDAYSKASADLGASADKYSALQVKIEEAKNTAETGTGSRRIAAEAAVPRLTQEALVLKDSIGAASADISDRYNKDYAKVADTITGENVDTAKTNAEYFQDLRDDLTTEAITNKGGKGLTIAERAAIDRTAKSRVDMRVAAIKTKTDAKIAQDKFVAREGVKTSNKIRVEKTSPKKYQQEQKKSIEADIDMVNYIDDSWMGDNDSEEYAAARSRIDRAGLLSRLENRDKPFL